MIRMIPVIRSHFGSSRPVERAVDLRSAVYIIDLSTLGFTPAPRFFGQRSVDPCPGDGGRHAEDHVPLQPLLGGAGDTDRALLVRGLRRLRGLLRWPRQRRVSRAPTCAADRSASPT